MAEELVELLAGHADPSQSQLAPNGSGPRSLGSGRLALQSRGSEEKWSPEGHDGLPSAAHSRHRNGPSTGTSADSAKGGSRAPVEAQGLDEGS
eukprot:s2368_g7.t1